MTITHFQIAMWNGTFFRILKSTSFDRSKYRLHLLYLYLYTFIIWLTNIFFPQHGMPFFFLTQTNIIFNLISSFSLFSLSTICPYLIRKSLVISVWTFWINCVFFFSLFSNCENHRKWKFSYSFQSSFINVFFLLKSSVFSNKIFSLKM